MPDLATLHAAAFGAADAHGWTADALTATLTDDAYVVILHDTAYALARPVADEAELLLIGTHPDHRRTGAARSVLDALITTLASCGTNTLFLEVAADNHAARTFYARNGFAETGRRARYYPRPTGPVDAITYARALP